VLGKAADNAGRKGAVFLPRAHTYPQEAKAMSGNKHPDDKESYLPERDAAILAENESGVPKAALGRKYNIKRARVIAIIRREQKKRGRACNDNP